MKKEKKRPTLEELKELPPIIWRLEVAQVAADAAETGDGELEDAATEMLSDTDLTPEKVVALRARLSGTGSTPEPALCGTGSTGEAA